MLERYNKETSQIHAPADLIQRTKEAMRAEEARLQQAAPANTADRAARGGYMGKARRWALPLTAAAAVVILVSVSTVMQSVKNDSSMAGDMASPESGADSDMLLSEGESDMPLQFANEDSVAEAAVESNEAVAQDAMPEEEKKAGTEKYEAPAEESVEEETESAEAENFAEVENFAEDKFADASDHVEAGLAEASKSTGAVGIAVTEVDEAPAFCDSADTEQVTFHNVLFYVSQEDSGEICAYAEVNDKRYLITGESMEQEELLEKAYAFLVKEMKPQR